MTESPGLPSRRVTLVLCTAADGVLGALPPFDAERPFWQEASGVVAGARERFGLDVVVLRLLSVAGPRPSDGGEVTYLAQVTSAHAAGGADETEQVRRAEALVRPWAGPDPLADHPLRAPYATPDGPCGDLAWVADALSRNGLTPAGPAVQERTWNLSTLWRVPALGTDGAPVTTWLKVVPHFFAHEGAVLAALAPTGLVPAVLDHGTGPRGCGRTLLADVPGEDQYGAGPDLVAGFAASLAAVHAQWAGRGDELAALGVPRRDDPAAVVTAAERVLDLTRTGECGAGRLDPALWDGARRLVDEIPDRLARAEAAGSRNSLVHGDFHPGNVRGVPGRWAVLDWGDSHVGQPAYDLVTAVRGFDAAGERQVVQTAQRAGLRSARPAGAALAGVDLAAAVAAVRPLGPLFAALVWQGFLDAIEPDEFPYHAGDPAAGLRDAVLAANAGS